MDAVARVPIVAPGAPPAAAPSARHGVRVLLSVLACTVLAGVLSGSVWVHRFATSAEAPAPVPAPSPLTALSNVAPIPITITTPAWTKVREIVTVDQLHTDHRLWRQMHFGDWDGVSVAYRETALKAMIRAHADLFRGPDRWRTMTAADWDDIPQPIRAMVYLRMIWHWAAMERVGVEFNLNPEKVALTIGAIVMAESWFEHRAINVNPWGNRDFGLAQCSDFCRAEIAAMIARCELLFRPTDADYFNPWIATRIATVWFRRELRNANGDLDLAARAYHRGIDQALDEKGDVYIARVQQLRDRYIRAQGPSETWRFLVREIRAL